MEVSLPYDPFVSLRNAGELCDDGRAPEIEHVVEYVIEHVIERLHVVHGTTTKRGKSCWQLGREKRGKYAPEAQGKLRLVASSGGGKREIKYLRYLVLLLRKRKIDFSVQVN